MKSSILFSTLKKASIKILYFASKLPYHLFTAISITIFILFASIFLFCIAIKTDPNRAATITTQILTKTLPLFQIQTQSIQTKIKNEHIFITIPYFKRYANNKSIELEGFNTHIAFSLSDIIHGNIYKITIEKFELEVNINNSTTSNESYSINKFYYLFLPSVHIDIKNLILNLNKKQILLNDAILKINQKGYILNIQANSTIDNYQTAISLNSDKLKISFSNIPSKILHKYTENKLNFINFTSATGFIIFNPNDTRTFNFKVTIDDIQIPQGTFIKKPVNLRNSTITGTANVKNDQTTITASSTPFLINEKSLASFEIKKNDTTSLNFKLENISIQEIRDTIFLKNIKNQEAQNIILYLEKTLKNANIIKTTGKINIPLNKPEDLLINITFKNANFEYHPHFAPITQANGTIEITHPKTIIMVSNATSAGNKIQKSKIEVFSHKTKLLLHTNGTIESLNDLFKTTYPKFLPKSSEISTTTTLEIPFSCHDIYSCMKISSNGKINNLQTLINNSPATGTFSFEKHPDQNAFIKTNLANFSNENLKLENFETEMILSNKQQNLELKINGQNSQNDQINIKSLKINTSNGTLTSINISPIKFHDNNFSIKYEQDPIQNIEIKGESINIPSTEELLKKITPQNNSNLSNIKLNFNINKVILYNNVESFAVGNVEIKQGKIQKSIIDSEIFSFHYFTPLHATKINQEILEQGIFIEVPDISTLVYAMQPTTTNAIKAGSLKIIGERVQNSTQDEVIWNGSINNLHFISEKFKFNTKKIKILASQKGNEITFKNLKIQDSNHTLFITGSINTQNMTINAKIFYTPSKVELLNEMPIIKNAIKITTFGTNTNGLLSLELDCTGSIFAPEIKFNKASPIKSLWKIIISLPFLPFIMINSTENK